MFVQGSAQNTLIFCSSLCFILFVLVVLIGGLSLRIDDIEQSMYDEL